MKVLRNIKLIAVAVVCIAIIIGAVYMCHFTKSVKTGHTTEVTVTPTPVDLDSIHNIGQWSFLSIELDQVVDTIDKGFFSSDRISVGYHGTLHYGIDMSKADKDWVKIENDTTVNITLPAITLLDKRFLDERNVKVYEGNDDMDFINKPGVRAALVSKAKAEMVRRGDQHKGEAQAKAESELRRLFTSHGYKKVNIQFKEK